ncbi:hypothetical protein N8482_01410 [Chitinophagales bacterium]|nr:hypothetical protein [Chitinophagales bacterium]
MKSIIILIASFLVIGLSAQSAAEALRYSQTTSGATARTLGAGGAFGALGADLGAMSINPAGLAQYRSSQFSITPSFNSSLTDASYLGELHTDNAVNIGLNNIGIVLGSGSRGKDGKGWVNSSFAVGLNRLNTFSTDRFISGYNDESSVTGRYSELASGINANNLSGELADAFNAYLIDPVGDLENNLWEGRVQEGNVRQEEINSVQGSMSELSFAFAGNYEDKVQIGASFNVPFIRYESSTSYREVDSEDEHADFDNLTVSDNLLTEGTGINGKLGMIFKVHDHVRIGGAFHSPTFFSMSDEYASSLSSTVATDGGAIEQINLEDNNGFFEYSLITPYKLVGSAAFLVPKFGFISVDYEYQDFSLARFDYDSTDSDVKLEEGRQNRAIKDNFKAASTIRIGGEYKLDALRFRLGYALGGSPIKSDKSATTNSLSGGLGFVMDGYSFDIGYRNSSTSYDYNLYTLSDATATAAIDERLGEFLFTLGFRF